MRLRRIELNLTLMFLVMWQKLHRKTDADGNDFPRYPVRGNFRRHKPILKIEEFTSEPSVWELQRRASKPLLTTLGLGGSGQEEYTPCLAGCTLVRT